ncbi:MAG: hypothetical protein NVSMB1_17590 [Polyangiales bacterium]
METGIDDKAAAKLETAETAGGLKETASAELEDQRGELARVRKDIDEAGEILIRSRKVTLRRAQLTFDDLKLDKREEEQFRREQQYMGDRLGKIQDEIQKEPPQIEALYKVALRRLEPVGLVFLWPETRG